MSGSRLLVVVAAVALAGCLGSPAPSPSTALAMLGLATPDGVSLTGPATLRAQSDGIIAVGGLRLVNHTATAYRFPFELTVLRWNAGSWTPISCREDQGATETPNLCGSDGNAEVVNPGEAVPPDYLTFVLRGPTPPQPGFYAFVLPLWAGRGTAFGGEEMIEGRATGAVAFVADVH